MKDNNMNSRSDKSAQTLVDNLNYNVKLDHIDFVDHGVRPIDDNYHIFKKEFIELWGQDEYDQESLQREDKVKELNKTAWKS